MYGFTSKRTSVYLFARHLLPILSPAQTPLLLFNYYCARIHSLMTTSFSGIQGSIFLFPGNFHFRVYREKAVCVVMQ